MISAINHHLQLSGNKLFYFFIVLAFLSSCTPSKKVQGNDVQIVKGNDPKKENSPTKQSTSPKVDTVKWTDVNEVPPIKDDVKTEKNTTPRIITTGDISIYKHITLVLPQSSDDTRFLQYYGGVKIAAEELEYEGLNLEIDVIEAGSTFDLNKINFNKTDLIFAPINEEQIKSIASAAKGYKKPVVSSWFSLSSIEDNPYYLQLKPSLRSHFTSMLMHIKDHFDVKDVVLVARSGKASELAWLKYFQSQAKVIFHTNEDKPLTEYFVFEDSITNGSNVFRPAIFGKGKKIFILPNYSYKDEIYLYGVMRRLHAERGDRSIHVYGMPILKDSEQMNYDYFKNLNVKVPSSRWVNYDSDEVKLFNHKFYDKYGAIAEDDSYDGFDNTLFIARNLATYGHSMLGNMQAGINYLHTDYDIKPFKAENSTHEIDYYENSHLDILEFKDTKFVKSE